MGGRFHRPVLPSWVHWQAGDSSIFVQGDMRSHTSTSSHRTSISKEAEECNDCPDLREIKSKTEDVGKL